MKNKRIAIVGGGICGLAAAFALQQRIKQQGLPLQLTVFEKDPRFGGKIFTEEVDGFTIEAGPDSILSRKRAATDLCTRLGIEDQLVPTDPKKRGSYIRHRGRLEPLPEGLSFLVPTRLGPFLRSQLLSPAGKLRMGLDLLIPRGPETGDESLANFVQRRLGHEALERVAEPLFSGIHAGDAYDMSLMATFPQFRQMEQRYGSLVRGMLVRRSQAAKKRSTSKPPPSTTSSSVPPSVFISLRTGLTSMVEALIQALDTADLKSGIGVRRVESRQDRSNGNPPAQPQYDLELTDGSHVTADAILLAVPAYAAGSMIEALAPTASAQMNAIPYASVAGVVLAYPTDEVSHPLNGTGYVIPRGEDRPITACTWVTSKWPHTSPSGWQLFRCHLGRANAEDVTTWPDSRLVAEARAELRQTLGITADPALTRVYRWSRAMPQYTVGHLHRVDTIERSLPPGIFVAGSAYRGVGIPDCIAQGMDVARELFQYIQSSQDVTIK